MIRNNDKLLIGRDDTSYHVALEDAGLATIDFINNVVENITDVTDALDVRITTIESGFTFSDTEIVANPEKNFKVGNDDLFVNVGSNHVGIGTHNPQKSLDIVSNDGDNRATARVQQYSNDNKGPWFNMTKGRGTDSSKQKVQYNDIVGELYFTSWTGSNTTSGIIRCQHSGTNNEGYGRLSFKTRGPDGLQTRLYTQLGGEVVVTKGLVLTTEDTDPDVGTFSMRDYTNNDGPLGVLFTKYRGNNPIEAEEAGGVAPAANLGDRLLPGDGVVRIAFGGWDGTHRRNLALFKVDCVDDNLTGEVILSSKSIGQDSTSNRIVIDGNGDTHIKNGNLVIDLGLTVNDTEITKLELSRLSGLTGNAQTQFNDRIKKSELLQMVQENNNYEDFRAALINLLT
jgi:hypothetical protein